MRWLGMRVYIKLNSHVPNLIFYKSNINRENFLVFGCSTIAIAIKGMYAYEYTYPLLCMKNSDAFLYKNLTAYDQILFVRAFQTALEHFGKES